MGQLPGLADDGRVSLCNLRHLYEAFDTLESYLRHQQRAFGPMNIRNFNYALRFRYRQWLTQSRTGQGLFFLGKVREYQGRIAES